MLDAITNTQDESTGLATVMWSSGNMELDGIDHNGVCDISGLLSAAENNSFFDDLPDIVDIITASSTESARVNDSLQQGDTAILANY